MRFPHRHIALATGIILVMACQGVQAALIENFDDVSTTPWSLTNSSWWSSVDRYRIRRDKPLRPPGEPQRQQ